MSEPQRLLIVFMTTDDEEQRTILRFHAEPATNEGRWYKVAEGIALRYERSPSNHLVPPLAELIFETVRRLGVDTLSDPGLWTNCLSALLRDSPLGSALTCLCVKGFDPTVPTATVGVDGACDLFCTFCHPANPDPDSSIEDTWARIVARLENLRKESSTRIQWSQVEGRDSEPTSFPRLREAMSRARELGFTYQKLETNGFRTGDRDYLSELRKNGLDELSLTFCQPDGLLDEELFGVSGVFDARCRTLRNARALGIAVAPSVLLLEPTFRSLPEILGAVLALLPKVPARPSIALKMVEATDLGIPATASRPLIPRLSELVPVLRAAIRAHPSEGFAISPLPRCVWDESFDNLSLLHAPTSEYAAGCSSCAGRGTCSGVPRGYLRVHGSRELRPI